MIVKVKRMEGGHGLDLPAYKTAGAAGFDLMAAIPEGEEWVIQPREFRMIPTGIAVALPKNHEMQVRSRSGLAVKHGVVILHGVGTVDEDYRGMVFAPLMNHSSEPFTIRRGDRIGQGVVNKVDRSDLVEVEELDDTSRGAGGFGSTGSR